MAIEEPAYSVLTKSEFFEIRRYEPAVVAQTIVSGPAANAGNQGFKLLAGYIFGNNKGSRKIAMTAPVAQSATRIAMTAPVAQTARDGGYAIQFTMPRKWTLDTLPEPQDGRVTLLAVPTRTVAVRRYRGGWSQGRYEEELAALRQALQRAGRVTRGEPVWARYSPPWIPWFLRRNEIWLTVDP
jgi:SOUL heme-binding protein